MFVVCVAVIKSGRQTTAAGVSSMMRTSLNLLHNFARRALLSVSSQTKQQTRNQMVNAQQFVYL